MDVHPLIRHEPDPDHPGWWSWDLAVARAPERFNAVIGKLLVRSKGPGRATCRMFPEERHANLGDMVHGGAILTFVDMAFFAGGRLAGADVIRAVTLDCNVRFLSPGRIGVPLDAELELLRETKRLAFFAGKVVQDGELIAAFTGALRKSTHSSPSSLGEGDRPPQAGGGGAGEGDRPPEPLAEEGGGGAQSSPERGGGPPRRGGGGASPRPEK